LGSKNRVSNFIVLKFKKRSIVKMMKEEKPDIIGLQEITLSHLKQLLQYLPHYSWSGTGKNMIIY